MFGNCLDEKGKGHKLFDSFCVFFFLHVFILNLVQVSWQLLIVVFTYSPGNNCGR